MEFINKNMIEIDFFKPSGKWYDCYRYEMDTDRMLEVIELIKANPECDRKLTMVIRPIGEWGFPVMIPYKERKWDGVSG